MADFLSHVFVGRGRELDKLRASNARSIAGRATTALILGEAGVGKSRLAAELTAEVESAGGLVVRSHGVELAGGELPLAGLAEVVRGLIRARGQDEVRQLLHHHGGVLMPLLPGGSPDSAVEVGRTSVITAAVALLEELSQDTLVCWLIEDMPWLDQATRDVAGYLATVAQDAKLLILVTARTTTGEPVPPDLIRLMGTPGATSIHLQPLTRDEVLALVDALSARVVTAEEAQELYRRSDGLPFFVEQLLDIPDGDTGPLHRVVLAGMDGLSDEARVCLRAAALAEPVLDAALLGAATGLAPAAFATALREVRSRGLLHPGPDGDILRFKHALLREAVEAEMLTSERRDLHRRWGDALEDADTTNLVPQVMRLELARHRYLSGDAVAAFPSVLDAARAVADVADTELQALWWRRTVELWPGNAQVVNGFARDQGLSRLVTALAASGATTEAVSIIDDELARGDGSWLRTLWLRAARASALRYMGVPSESLVPPDDVDSVMAKLAGWPPDFHADETLHLLLHEWEFERPDLYPRACLTLHDRARAASDGRTEFIALRHLSWGQLREGDVAGHLQTAVRALDQAGTAWTVHRFEAENDVVEANIAAGRYTSAIEIAEHRYAHVERPRTVPYMYGRLCGLLAGAHLAVGQWDRALHVAQTGLSLRPAIPPLNLLASVLGQTYARRGMVDDAVNAIAAAPPGVPGAHGEMVRENLLRAVGEADVALALDDPDGLMASLDLGASNAPSHFVRHFWELLLTVARGGPHHDDITNRLNELVDDHVGRADPSLDPVGHAAGLEVAARLGRSPLGADADPFTAAEQVWNAVHRPYDVAWCQMTRARACFADGRQEQGSALLRQAWTTADQLGAVPLRVRTEALGRRNHAPLGRSTESAHHAAGLTARELEVLRLVAEGHSNGDIAKQLYMAPKTASVHVSRILSKLNAGNRTEAAALARRRGLLP